MRSFVPNPNFPRELEREPSYAKALAQAAEPAAAAARNFAPFDPSHTGKHYRDGIKVTVDGDQVRIDAMWWTSHFIEFGTVDTPTFAPLRRGVRAAGLRFNESSK